MTEPEGPRWVKHNNQTKNNTQQVVCHAISGNETGFGSQELSEEVARKLFDKAKAQKFIIRSAANLYKFTATLLNDEVWREGLSNNPESVQLAKRYAKPKGVTGVPDAQQVFDLAFALSRKVETMSGPKEIREVEPDALVRVLGLECPRMAEEEFLSTSDRTPEDEPSSVVLQEGSKTQTNLPGIRHSRKHASASALNAAKNLPYLLKLNNNQLKQLATGTELNGYLKQLNQYVEKHKNPEVYGRVIKVLKKLKIQPSDIGFRQLRLVLKEKFMQRSPVPDEAVNGLMV
jgi:hypothetical protein